MIKTFTFNAAVLEDDRLFDKYMGEMSPMRRSRVETMRRRRDRNLSLGAGIAIDLGLREYGLREKDIRYGKNQYGKPYFIDFPEIHFNVSHSGTMALAAFSERPVGCDIEKIREARLKIAERFFCPEETQYILSSPDPGLAFWRIWTLKESFLKAIGTGIGAMMNSFCLKLYDNRVTVTQSINENEYAFFERTENGYRIAVCEMDTKTKPQVII